MTSTINGEVAVSEPVGQWAPVEVVRKLEADLAEAMQTIQRLKSMDEDRNAAARQWADDNDLCSQFERFCEDYGWQGRTYDVDVEIAVSATVWVSLGDVPRDELSTDYIAEQITQEMVEERVREASLDWSVEDWQNG